MITMADLRDSWNSINAHAGQSIGRRADETHPLPFFISYNEEGKMQLMLVLDFLPQLPKSSQQISVRGNRRNDGKYAVCFSLENNDLTDQYVALCWDLLQCTYNAENTHSGAVSAVKRFQMWQKLFAEQKNKKLSEAEVKGLIGELAVFRDIALLKYSPQVAAEGWVGPLGADRDFEFIDTWYEVKSKSLSRPTVSISSIDQLDSNREGYLAILGIEKGSGNDAGGMTLNSLVQEIKTQLMEDGSAASVFESRLIAARYDSSDEKSDIPFVLYGKDFYEVSNDFPRIRRTDLPASVANGTYELSIAGIQSWKCTEKQAAAGIKVG